jgi:hypothetical protein
MQFLFSVLRIRDVYPRSRIPDPTTATKEEGQNVFFFYFFVGGFDGSAGLNTAEVGLCSHVPVDFNFSLL